jgi:TatD DNase family protein
LTSLDAILPALDCHAHIAPEVTAEELERLGDAVVFAVTRSLEESELVRKRRDRGVIWGCGVHPGVGQALSSFDGERFKALAEEFVLIGEVGLDAKAGRLEEQVSVFTQVMKIATERRALCSIHSAGCAELVLRVVENHRPAAPILHWFTGDAEQMGRAEKLGCWFSINVRMSDAMLLRIPKERALPETDYPFTRRQGVRMPGDIGGLEERMARLWGSDPIAVRIGWYRNLRELVRRAAIVEEVPEVLWSRLVSV